MDHIPFFAGLFWSDVCPSMPFFGNIPCWTTPGHVIQNMAEHGEQNLFLEKHIEIHIFYIFFQCLKLVLVNFTMVLWDDLHNKESWYWSRTTALLSPVKARDCEQRLDLLDPHPPASVESIYALRVLQMMRCNRVIKTSLGGSNCTFRCTI